MPGDVPPEPPVPLDGVLEPPEPPEGVLGLVLLPPVPVPLDGVVPVLPVGLVLLPPPEPVPDDGVLGLLVLPDPLDGCVLLLPPDPVPLDGVLPPLLVLPPDPVPLDGMLPIPPLVPLPPDDGVVELPELSALYVTASVMVWLVPSGATTSTSICPATAGGAITMSMVGAPSFTMVAGCPPISTLAPDGMAVP